MLEADIGWRDPWLSMPENVPQAIALAQIPPVTPSLVARVIRGALERGWKLSGGGRFSVDIGAGALANIEAAVPRRA